MHAVDPWPWPDNNIICWIALEAFRVYFVYKFVDEIYEI